MEGLAALVFDSELQALLLLRHIARRALFGLVHPRHFNVIQAAACCRKLGMCAPC